MQRYVKSESLVDTFLRYHDDESNWSHNRSGFDKMYEILEKYDDSNGSDTVDVAFMKATPEDQEMMVKLITPALRVGQDGYAKQFYHEVLPGEYGKGDYYDGVKDAFDALFREGFLDKSDFEMPY